MRKIPRGFGGSEGEKIMCGAKRERERERERKA